MADAEGIREAKHPSGQMGSQPRDLLQRFIHGRNNFSEKNGTRKEEEEEIELSLGLSLNGRFGVDPERAKNLIRSSSISSFMMNSEESRGECLDAYGALTRTCSLPAETEDDWRKRKELQSQKRMEVKRKRLEKIKNVRVVRGRSASDEICEQNEREGLVVPFKNGELSTPIGPEWKGEKEISGAIEGTQASIASIGSGGSSGVSDPESQPSQVTGTNLARVHSLPPKIGQKPIPSHGVKNSSPDKVTAVHKNGNESVEGMMVDMPCVFTRGDGPNGKRIEGFLYRYRKGEEVKIVCVCHGSSLSPAEFVKHAGGVDVAHPLRHIVVCNSPSPFL